MADTKISAESNQLTAPVGTERSIAADGSTTRYWTFSTMRKFVNPVVDIRDYAAPTDGTDASTAFNNAIAALPSTGGLILLEPGKRYSLNITVAKNNVSFRGDHGGGDGNVLTGFTPYNSANPALTIGDGTTQLRKFKMEGVRVYSSTANKGILINGAAYVDLEGEFGGFVTYALAITSTAAASSYYIRIHGKFFAVAATTGNLIDLTYGAGFVAAVTISGSIDVSAAGAGAHAVRVGDQVEVYFADGTWFQLIDGKGIKVEGTGRAHAGRVKCDSPASTDVLIEWPSTEIYPNSYFIGGWRIDGKGKNSAAATYDLTGINSFGHGFEYGPRLYRPSMIGPVELRATGDATGPLLQSAGGSPEGSITAPVGSLFVSTNNSNEQEILWVKVSGSGSTGWRLLPAGFYAQQTAPSNVASAATCHIGTAGGDKVYISGTVTITSFGSDSSVKTGVRVLCQAIGAFTITHNAASMYLLGQTDLTMISGDQFVMEYQGSGNWRMVDFMPFDRRLAHPIAGWATWTGTKNRTSKATGSATLADVAQTLGALIDDLFTHGLIKV
jgi:hypothetical protein